MSEQKFPKTHINYWKDRLKIRTANGTYQVQIRHKEKQRWFALDSTNITASATKARDIWTMLKGAGWDATEAKHKPKAQEVRNSPTVGQFLKEVKAKSNLRPATYEDYARAFRRLVSDIFHIGSKPDSELYIKKHDYENGGYDEWRGKVESIKLKRLTAERIQAWKVRYVREHEVGANGVPTPIKSKQVRNSANSIIRRSKSLWSKKILKFVSSSEKGSLALPENPFIEVDFEKKGWSIKKSLRKMVLSRSFRSSSQAGEAVKESDPENVYLSYYTPRRLDAEAIQDSMNSLTGKNYKRAVYAQQKRNSPDLFLKTFNLPMGTTTRSKRDITNVPAQALTLLNGGFVEGVAEKWSARIREDKLLENKEDRIDALFMDAYGRKATDLECKQILSYFNDFENEDVALKHVAFSILNSKEFIYVY